MSEDLSQKRVLWVDNGLFIAFALRCAPAFKETFFWTPWANAFPKSNSLLVGDGFDEITRVRWLHDAIEKADLIVFPDVYWGDLQEKLVRDGKRVWGARKGEIIELNRWKAKELMQKYGVNPSPAHLIYGLKNLRTHLKEHPDVWVKISTVRGDFETFQSETYRLSEPKLDELETKLGAKKDIAEFIVETNIEPAVEWGIDAFTIDGQWPERTLAGLEIKDLGFLGRVMEWSEIPDYLRAPNEKLSPWFKEKQYRGFFSTELRITDDREVYLIDPCARLPSPPNEIQQMVFDNWPEILWEGAEGRMVAPNTVAKYGVCAMLHSAWSDGHWQAVDFPEEVRPFVKLRNHTRIGGRDYVVPQEVGLPEMGAVIGLGDTLDDAIEHLKENAKQVRGYFIESKLEAIDKALEERDKAEKLGLYI